jgi:murein DD-endopeptidase MepM/ murein hydrolase activator NlpD
MKRLVVGGLLCCLVACQSALPSATPTSEASATPLLAASATLAPTAIPTAFPTLVWPTYIAPTLAPFPLDADAPDPNDASTGSIPPNSSVPLALQPNDHFYFSRPIRAIEFTRPVPSSRYGALQTGGDEPDAHIGLDISVDSGTPILAAAPGTVIWASYGLLYNSPNYIQDPYGIAIVIRHDFGYDGEPLFTVYAHLSEAKVDVGQRVERGEVIALSGNTGQSTGPHLHFEVRVGTNTIYFTRNPELWLAPPQDWGVLAGRVASTNGTLQFNHLLEITSLDSGRRYTTYSYATEFKLLPDDYYRENFVLGDLPAGRYEIAIPYFGVWRRIEVDVQPGIVTYFDFRGTNGYNLDLPADPPPANVPNN